MFVLNSADSFRMKPLSNHAEPNESEGPTEGPGIAIPLLNKSESDSVINVATELINVDPEEVRHDPVSNTAIEILGSDPHEEDRHDPVAIAALDVMNHNEQI